MEGGTWYMVLVKTYPSPQSTLGTFLGTSLVSLRTIVPYEARTRDLKLIRLAFYQLN